MESWLEADYPVRSLRVVSPADLDRNMHNGNVDILDVRNDEEWHEGHISNSIHVMAGQLLDNLSSVPKAADQLAVVCGSG